MFRIIFVLTVFLIALPTSLLSSLNKWTPINQTLSASSLNSSAVVGNKIYAVGEYGVIKVTDFSQNYTIARGDFTFANLNDISYDGNSTLLAVGENSSLVISDDNGLSWSDIEIESIDNFKSVAFFNNSFFIASENAIYEYVPNTSVFKLITNQHIGINKLHSTNDYLYVIGQQGLLLQYSDEEFTQLSINTSENISEIISRGNKIILFPNKEYAILTDDNFASTSRFNTLNNLFFIRSAAWIDDDLIIGIGSQSNIPPNYHAFSNNLLQSWNTGSAYEVPQRSLKGFDNIAVITAERGAIVYISNTDPFSPNFSMFDRILTLEGQNTFFERLSRKGNKIYAFGTNYQNLHIDITNLELEPILTEIVSINDAIFFNNNYFILKNYEKTESGMKYYLNYVLKVSGNDIDTVFKNDNYIRAKMIKIEEVNNKLLIYGSDFNIYVKDAINDHFEAIELTGYVRDLVIHNNTIYCIMVNEGKTYLAKSLDAGKTFENIISFDYLRKVSVYEDNIYFLTTTFGTGMTRYHTVYKFLDNPEIIYEFSSNSNIFKFHVYDDLIFMMDLDNSVFTTDGGVKWVHESFGNIGGRSYDAVAYNNNVVLSKGNTLYHRFFDITSSVFHLTHKNKNEITLFPNPTRDILNMRTDELISRVELSDVLGNVVISDLTPTLSKGEGVSINVENLPAGMYFLKLYTMSGEVLVEKVIVGF